MTRLITGMATTAAVSLAALAIFAQPADAAPKPIAGFIGAGFDDTGGQFDTPRAAAVYTGADSNPQNDKLLVVDGGNNRVQRLDSHGNFERLWGRDVIRSGAPGDTGVGAEICTAATSGAANCKSGLAGSGGGEFNNPVGVAVNQATGHVYVTDRGNSRVQELDLDGNFIRAWGSAGSDPVQFAGIAVDPVNGDVFVADPGNGRVERFQADGTIPDPPAEQSFGTGAFGAGEPRYIAVDSNHIVYMSDSSESNQIQRYDAQADVFLTPISCCAPSPGSPLADGTTVGLAVDPDTDGAGTDEEHLLVARDPSSDNDTVVQELDIPSPPEDPVVTVVDTHVYETDPDEINREIDRTVAGIAINPTTGFLYLVTPSIFSEASGNGSFTGCASQLPCQGLLVLSAESSPVEAVLTSVDAAATSASVVGSANAGGGVATYRFEINDGGDWRDSGAGGYVSRSDDVPVSGQLTGLEPNTAYQVRMVVRRQTGFSTAVSVTSNVLTLMTDQAPPDVQTLGSTQRTDRGAQLRGRVDPNGLPTSYHFEYGLAGGPLSTSVPVPDGSVGSGNSPIVVFQDVTGLQPGTTYEYRIVASNGVQPNAVGARVSFTTEQNARSGGDLTRGYELVSPADKVGGVGVGTWYEGPASIAHVGTAAHVGERFAVAGVLGSVLVDGPYTYSNDWALAERTAAGWTSAPGISRRAYGPQGKADITLTAAADDLSLTSWGSGGHTLRLFPEMESWASHFVLMLRNWADGRWQLFGPTAESQETNSSGQNINIASGPKAIAADGSAVVASGLDTRGLAGPGDPTNVSFPDLQQGGSVYYDDVSEGMTDTFPGDDGVRTLINVCTADTMLPARRQVGPSSFEQYAERCPAPRPDGQSARLISPSGASLGDDTEGVISADGSRVLFMSPDPLAVGDAPCSGTGVETTCPPQLFVWQRDSQGQIATRWISRTDVTVANGAAAEQDSSLIGPAFFEGASRDGDKVFFRTSSPLTEDDRNGSGTPPPGGVTTGNANDESWDLYMYDLPNGPDQDPATADADPVGGDLVRISAGPNGSGDCNVRSGTLRLVSDDGSRAYFTCSAPLPGVPEPASGTRTGPGGTRTSADEANLYVYDSARPLAERWRFVARLPRTSELGACATTATDRGAALSPGFSPTVSVVDTASCVRGTADGSFVTLFTDGRLTDDDPDAVSGDMYGYDATGDELTRMSRPQGGAGEPYSCTPPIELEDGALQCYGDGGIGLPSMPLARLGVATRPDGERLAFFESASQLVPEDRDDAYDVYQWRALDGRLSLISTGTSSTDGAFFIGNDRSGLNVYLATRDRLTWQDKDAALDIYTARLGGGIPEPPGPPRCDVLGDVCQGPGAPPGASGVNSDTAGGGNATPGKRVTLARPKMSRRARVRAARSGVLRIGLRVSRPATLAVSVRARLGGRTRTVAAGRKRVAKAGKVTMKLRLNRPARRRLAAGRALRLRITVRARDAVPKTTHVTLKRRES